MYLYHHQLSYTWFTRIIIELLFQWFIDALIFVSENSDLIMEFIDYD